MSATGPQKIAAWFTVSEEVLADSGTAASFFLRWTDPWEFPDPNQWPTFTPLPRLERARIGLSVARTCVRDAWSVLRGRETLSDEGDDW